MRVTYCGFFFFKQKTAYEMRISDWSSDVCSSDLVCNVTIASTAAKLIWKLGPISDSGHSSRTKKPATATIRMDSASRPSASAISTRIAAAQLRTVGTSAPVSSVYPIPANAPQDAATTGRRTRNANHGHSAKSLIAKSQPAAIPTLTRQDRQSAREGKKRYE